MTIEVSAFRWVPPVAQGYVAAGYTKAGTPLKLIVRGKALDAEVATLPFTPNRYKR